MKEETTFEFDFLKTTMEVSQMLGVDVRRVNYLVQRGDLKPIKRVGIHFLFNRADIVHYQESLNA